MRALMVFFALVAGIFAAESSEVQTLIVQKALDPRRPVVVKVNPSIATTIAFPSPIGAPMGTGFVEDEAYERAKSTGMVLDRETQYVITFNQGDSYFTIKPLARAGVINLNVPYQGRIIVLLFMPVEEPLKANASMTFVEKLDEEETQPLSAPKPSPTPTPLPIERVDVVPPSSRVPVSVPRLDGFLTKLTVIHAAGSGSELEEISKAMGLSVAISTAEDPKKGRIQNPVNEQQFVQIVLLRVVRDSKLDAVGFILLLRNTSSEQVAIAPTTFAARCRDALYTAAIADAPTVLAPKEVRPAYFAIAGTADGRPNHMAVENDWRVSVSERMAK